MPLSQGDLSAISKWLNDMVRRVELLEERNQSPADDDLEFLRNTADKVRERVRTAGGATGSGEPPPDAPRSGHEPTAEASGPGSFADFFREIGEGLMETQQELDRRSERYLESIKDRAHLVPTVFRVPEVSGRLKVGLEQRQDRKLNFIVFGSSSSARNWAEHEIDFKVTAVPPPPEARETLRRLPGALSLVLGAAQRTQVFAAIARCLDETDPGGEFDGDAFGQGTLAQTARALGGPRADVLIWASGDADFLIVAGFDLTTGTRCHGAWRLQVPADTGGPSRLSMLWRVSAAQREREFQAVDPLLAATYDAQRRLLEGLPPPPGDG